VKEVFDNGKISDVSDVSNNLKEMQVPTKTIP